MGNGVRAVRQCCAHHYSHLVGHLCPDVFRRRLTGNCVCLVCVPARPGVFEHARAASAHARERASERVSAVTPPSIAIEAPVLGGPESVRVCVSQQQQQ